MSTEEEVANLLNSAFDSNDPEIQKKVVAFITKEFVPTAKKRIALRRAVLYIHSCSNEVKQSLLTTQAIKQMPTEEEVVKILTSALDSNVPELILKAVPFINKEFVPTEGKRMTLQGKAIQSSNEAQEYLLSKENIDTLITPGPTIKSNGDIEIAMLIHSALSSPSPITQRKALALIQRNLISSRRTRQKLLSTPQASQFYRELPIRDRLQVKLFKTWPGSENES